MLLNGIHVTEPHDAVGAAISRAILALEKASRELEPVIGLSDIKGHIKMAESLARANPSYLNREAKAERGMEGL